MRILIILIIAFIVPCISPRNFDVGSGSILEDFGILLRLLTFALIIQYSALGSSATSLVRRGGLKFEIFSLAHVFV